MHFGRKVGDPPRGGEGGEGVGVHVFGVVAVVEEGGWGELGGFELIGYGFGFFDCVQV